MTSQEELGTDLCDECGSAMNNYYRFTDWYYEENDLYGSFKECEEVFNARVKDDPEGRFSIYDISTCDCGNFRDEGVLFNDDCPEYEVGE